MTQSSILDKTTNLLSLYAHHTGESEVPPEFHDWSCLSLISACVADRVWLEKFRGSRLTPNLYVFLVGPSGLGKGVAIETALSFAKGMRRIRVYHGRATAQHMYDFLGRPSRNDRGISTIANPKVWLVTDELSADVGEGSQAVTFIKTMTKLYMGSDTPIQEGTRTRGEVIVTDPNINWLAGTTRDWLLETVPKSSVTGGFFGRCVAVEAKYDLSKRLRRPLYPYDYDLVVEHLRARLQVLAYVEGKFEQTEEATAVEEAWYIGRDAPTDEALLASWKREHDLTLKLAMLFSLCDDVSLRIERRHMVQAQRATRQVMQALPRLIDAASTTTETAGIQYVAETIEKQKRIHHSTLVQRCYNRGINAERLREIVETLVQARRVERMQAPGLGGWIYSWKKRRRLDEARVRESKDED